MRTLWALLFLWVPAIVWAQVPEEDILRTLLAQDNRIGVASYLKRRHATFYDAAIQAGLVEYLDGEIDFTTLRSRVDPSHQGVLDMIQKSLDGQTGKLAVKHPSPKVAEVYAAGALEDPVKMAELLQKPFYTAERHPLTSVLDASRWKAVPVTAGQGKLVWFNPYLSIPELGIRAGEPMTEAQRDAIMKLFAVKTTKDAAAAFGTAFYPEDVGRALNPTSGIVTILTDNGEVLPELVSKGTGPNVMMMRDGLLDLSEAYMDAEVSRNLMKAGATPFTPVAVIDTGYGKAVYVRAAGSLLRHSHLPKYSGPELSKLIELVMSNRTMGAPTADMPLRAWAGEWLPTVSGFNAGVLSGIGIKHGSLVNDNAGLRGELVDWGYAEFGHPGDDEQKEKQWEFVRDAIDRVNRVSIESTAMKTLKRIAHASKVPTPDADTDTQLRQRILKRFKDTPLKLEGVDEPLARKIVTGNKGYVWSGESIDSVLRKAVEQLQELTPGTSPIGGITRAELETLARGQGLEVNVGDTDLQIAERVINEVKTWQQGQLKRVAVDLDEAQKKFDAEYARGKAVGTTFDVKLVERFMEHADVDTLCSLAKGFVSDGYGKSKQELTDILKQKGVIEADGDVKSLPPEPKPKPTTATAGANDRARSLLKEEVVGAGRFAAAYLLKEGIKALETRDAEAMKRAVLELGTGRFWVDLGVFSVAARGAEHLLVRTGAGSLLRSALPLAAGMTAIQLIHGRFSGRDVMIDTAAFLAAGFVVNFASNSLLYPMFFTAGPPGMIGAALYSVGKLAVTLYGGEKLGLWLRGFGRRAVSRESGGVLDKVRRLVPQE